ncbi:AbrB/MazE/SpoVT family DNA-binding domain-containing protein [Candidatus Woesearchaeota archaeon]|nr:AbrB/MazE/SpoVT family DNA-binding domain-containing protein [Candidatus Woesearchaeota archaeon]
MDKKISWMSCVCGKKAYYEENLRFNGYSIDGWKCKHCGEEYFNPGKAEFILLLNKIKKKKYNLKLNRVRSNLILRIPKEISTVLNLSDSTILQVSLEKGGILLTSPLPSETKTLDFPYLPSDTKTMTHSK